MDENSVVAVARKPLVPPAAYRWVLSLRPRLIPEGLVAVLILLLAGSFIIQTVSPFDPLAGSLVDRFKPPSPQLDFWNGHLLGTDQQGRDLFVRLLVGARYSMAVAAIALAVAGTVGLALGMIAGYFGGIADSVIMRAADFVLAIPMVLVVLILAAVFGPSLLLVSVVLGSYLWAVYARMIRAEAMALMSLDFIKLSRVAGASAPHIIVVHIFPHVTSTFLVLLSLQVGSAILAEASLSFLGAGIPPPLPAWGSMVAEGRRYIREAWWISVFPGIAIMIVVFCFNLIGDWVRDRLDPRLS